MSYAPGLQRKRVITAYVKPTNACNIGCTHCYLSEAVRADHARMSLTVLETAARMLQEMAARGHADVSVLWHGGEPMTLRPSWYEHAGRVLDEILPTRQESMQTSLIPYDSQWAELVHRRFQGGLGSSMDFRTRHIKGSSEAYQELWLRKVEHARADGIHVVPGIVVSRHEIGRAHTMVAWMEAHGFDTFNVERFNAFGSHHAECPTNAEHAAFLRDLFDAVMSRWRAGVYIEVRVLHAALGGVMRGVPGDRWGTTCQSDFVVIEPDGSINSCPDRASHEAPHANVSNGYPGLMESADRRRWIRVQAVGHRNDHCAHCEYQRWCRSGCPITPNDPIGQGDCSGYRSFLNHVRAFCEAPDCAQLAASYLSPSIALPPREHLHV